MAALPSASNLHWLRYAFLFPSHTWANHYQLPRAEVEAFGEVIGPALHH